jgi:deazaflavin-dependent oxidoreductase (nitroreductase family)
VALTRDDRDVRGPGPKPADEAFCYVTTTGRVSGKPHEIEIWFALSGSTIYMLAGGGERPDWVRNLRKDPHAQVRIGDKNFSGTARVGIEGAEGDTARSLVFDKYQPTYKGDLSQWRESSLVVAIDLPALL